MVILLQLLDLLLNIAQWIIIVQAILSWLVVFNVINTQNEFVRQLYRGLDRLTEPLYRPIRRVLPDFGGIDFSPFLVLILIMIVRSRIIAPLIASSY